MEPHQRRAGAGQPQTEAELLLRQDGRRLWCNLRILGVENAVHALRAGYHRVTLITIKGDSRRMEEKTHYRFLPRSSSFRRCHGRRAQARCPVWSPFLNLVA